MDASNQPQFETYVSLQLSMALPLQYQWTVEFTVYPDPSK